MKRFLDKTWAKAAAFVLTLVFGVLIIVLLVKPTGLLGEKATEKV